MLDAIVGPAVLGSVTDIGLGPLVLARSDEI